MNRPANLLVILGSNRPGRIGERVGQCVLHSLAAYPEFTVDFADLAQMDLGFTLSAHHPPTGIYEGGARELAAKLRTHIIRNGIAMGGASQKINEDGKWIGAEVMGPAFKSVVDELYWWADTLKAARRENAYPA